MILRLLAGLWLTVVALGASFGVTQWKLRQAAASVAAADAPKKKPDELRKLKPITVPRISNGQVQGYSVATLSFYADGEMLKSIDVQPDAFVTDEVFRLLYAEERLDPRSAERFDIPRFASAVKTAVNARLKAEIVRDILVQEFAFVGAEEVRK